MASSYQYLNCSKAQMCLFKILHIISSIPASKEEACSSHGDDGSGSGSFPSNNKGAGIDLNLRFCSVAESGESESSVIDQGNNEEGEEAKAEVIREKSVEVSEGRDTQVESFKVENNEVGHVESESEEDREGNEGCDGGKMETASFGDNSLDLLIEAAKVLSKRDESDSEEDRRGLSYELRTRRASERNELLELEEGVKRGTERWVVVDLNGGDAEESEPVVRSKRGRNRALPRRFRDSVLEPLRRPLRPSSTAPAKKRRLLWS